MADSRSILNVALIGFSERLDMRCERCDELQMSQGLVPSNWNGAIGRMVLGSRHKFWLRTSWACTSLSSDNG